MGCWRQLHFTSLATWRQGTTTAMGTMVTMRMTTAMLRCELACVRCVTTMGTAYHGSWWEWEILARLTNCGTNGGCFHFTSLMVQPTLIKVCHHQPKSLLRE